MLTSTDPADILDAAHVSLGEGVARLALAALLGGLVGFEREYAGRDAGVRTHALLALGAALFALVSVGGFATFALTTSQTNVLVDVTRVASYVAAAVGFIGGGAIIKGREGVRGLTTAATLWVTCAVGLACGVGLLALAAVVAACALVTLLFERPMRVVRRRLGISDAGVVVVAPASAAHGTITGLLDEIRARNGRDVRVTIGDADGDTRITAKIDPSHLLGLFEQVRAAGCGMEFDADLVRADRPG